DAAPAGTTAWDRAVRRLRRTSYPPQDTQSSGAVFDEGPAPDSESLAAQRFDEGLDLVRAGEHEHALRAWQEAAALTPSNRLYQSNLRILRRRLGMESSRSEE
ncbi:MAG: hypothetical protein ACOC1F_13340, partial [Myxococcota bacterium]